MFGFLEADVLPFDVGLPRDGCEKSGMWRLAVNWILEFESLPGPEGDSCTGNDPGVNARRA